MAYKITDACIACGACAAECPVGAITEGDGKFEINPDMCVHAVQNGRKARRRRSRTRHGSRFPRTQCN